MSFIASALFSHSFSLLDGMLINSGMRGKWGSISDIFLSILSSLLSFPRGLFFFRFFSVIFFSLLMPTKLTIESNVGDRKVILYPDRTNKKCLFWISAFKIVELFPSLHFYLGSNIDLWQRWIKWTTNKMLVIPRTGQMKFWAHIIRIGILKSLRQIRLVESKKKTVGNLLGKFK